MKILCDLKPNSLNQINKICELLNSFGLQISENLTIKNDLPANTPIYVPEENAIYLTTDTSKDYYQQVSYQFSHEVIHAIVYEVINLKEYDGKIHKINEITAVAFSLYFLLYEFQETNILSWQTYFKNEVNRLKGGKHLYSEWQQEIFLLLNEFRHGRRSIMKAIGEACVELSKTNNFNFNINEFFQFSELCHFAHLSNQDGFSTLFSKNKKVCRSLEPYDAQIEMNDNQKFHIQLTTMSNFVAINKKGSEQNPKKISLHFNKEQINNDLKIEARIKQFEDKNIKMEVQKPDDNTIYKIATFSGILKNEIDFDNEYGIDTSHLINAIVRILSKKASKYNVKDKKSNSTLVIFDESLNVFYLAPLLNNSSTQAWLDSRCEIQGFEKVSMNEWNVMHWFTAIFYAAMDIVPEIKIFFDYVQVIFHQAESSDSDEKYFIVDNSLPNIFPLNHPIHNSRIGVVSMNRSHSMTAFIPIDNADK